MVIAGLIPGILRLEALDHVTSLDIGLLTIGLILCVVTVIVIWAKIYTEVKKEIYKFKYWKHEIGYVRCDQCFQIVRIKDNKVKHNCIWKGISR